MSLYIKEAKTGFSSFIDIGKFSYIVDVSKSGVPNEIKDMATKVSGFKNILIKGDEPFNQREDLAKFVNKALDLNPQTRVSIFTTGVIRPVKLTKVDRLSFYVNVQLKHSGIDYNKRVNEQSFKWFKNAGANFIFNVRNTDDYDEAITICRALEIPKNKIFFAPESEFFEKLYFRAVSHGYNIAVEVCEDTWPKEQEMDIC